MQKIIKNSFYILLGYLALYTTIWLHELGHSLVYYLHQCKENLFQLDVPFHFANANPGQVDVSCAEAMSTTSQVLAGMGGILINLMIGIPGSLALRKWAIPKHRYVYFFLLFFVLAHLSEACSYMTISNIIPLSDILSLETHVPLMRIPLFLGGIWVAYIMYGLIRESDTSLRQGMIWFSGISMVAMGGLRLLFTLIHQ